VSAGPLDWDAASYDRVADPQEEWAQEIIARMRLRADDVVLDAGCGSGRVTRLLLERLPRGRVIGVDSSPAMVQRARETLGPDSQVEVHCQDLLDLQLEEPVAVIFSCAVFHHIHDHERLFWGLRAALRQGGRLVAQCGGEGNIARFRRLADAVSARGPYAEYLDDMDSPWHYAGPLATEARLRAAGFESIRCWLEPKPTIPADARGFAESVLLNYHLERLHRLAPASKARDLSDAFVAEVIAEAGDPLELEYVRLNIEASAA
jgi:trans-aconitate 2-methyltransferase